MGRLTLMMYKKYMKNMKRRNEWGDTSVDGKILLKWIFNETNVKVWNEFNWLLVLSR